MNLLPAASRSNILHNAGSEGFWALVCLGISPE
jgi:hypothetical protein